MDREYIPQGGLIVPYNRRFAFGQRFKSGLGGLNTGIAKRGGQLVGLGALLSVLDAAGELADPNDPFLRNVSEGAGTLGGGLGGAALGATLGSVVPGVGTAIGGLVGGGLGYMAGSGIGKAVGGGAYDLVAGDSAGRARRTELADARNQLKIAKEAIAIQDESARENAVLATQLLNQQNFANTMYQQSLDQTRMAGARAAAINQYLLG